MNHLEEIEKAGYKVSYEGAIPYIIVSAEEYDDPNTYKKLTKLIKDIGHNKSWGIKPERKQDGDRDNKD